MVLATTSMKRGSFHHWVSWLVLLWFGVSSAVLTGGVVVCRDAHGGVRIEWGCERTAAGQCVVKCDEEPLDEPGLPLPCQDTPIAGDELAATALPRSTGNVTAPVLLAAPVLDPWMHSALGPIPARAHEAPDRPPDSLARLRTVVLGFEVRNPTPLFSLGVLG